MSVAMQYLECLSQGMAIIRDSGELAHAAPELSAVQSALPRLLDLHETYFGTTRSSAKQRDAVEAALDNGHSLPVIEMIEQYAKQIKNSDKSWHYRLEMLRTTGELTELRRAAKKLLAKYVERKEPKPGVEITRSKGLWALKISGPSADIADMAEALGTSFDSAKEFFFGGTQATRARVTTNLVITLNELDRIIGGHGADIQLRMTNGARITGAEFITRELSAFGLVTLVHPVQGPVNLYRTSRLASAKQRAMALAENPTCAWPGCNAPGESSQIHHLKSWKQGGMTNPENLCTLCHYHNAINEDDKEKPQRRGKMVRREGRITWLPPWSS